MRPARFFRHPKNIGGEVFVFVFRVRTVELGLAFDQFGVLFIERIRDVLEEDEAEDDVLVFGRVHVVAQLVGGEPELGFKADVGGGVGFLAGRFGH